MRLTLPVCLLFVSVLCSSFQGAAQNFCNEGGGGFEVTPSEGCAPLTVNIKNTVANPLDVGYELNYRVGVPAGFVNIPTYRYSAAGTFTMLQKVFVGGNVGYACRQIRVYESAPVVAQYTACGGGKVNLTIQNDRISQAYDGYEIDWGDGQVQNVAKGQSFSFEHNYSDVSVSPTVKIAGTYANNSACTRGLIFSQEISFQQAQLNSIEIQALEMRGDGSLRLTYQGVVAIPTDIKYSQNGSSYTTAGRRSSGGVQPYDIGSLNAKQLYQVKLSSQDLCNGQRDSKVIHSMTLDGKSDEGKNVLTWSKYGDPAEFSGYDLLRDGTVIKSFTSIDETTYTDEDVECGSYSDYQIVAKIGVITSTSAPVGVKTDISSPQRITAGSVSVIADNAVMIKADVPGSGPNSSFSMTIERAEAGGTLFKKIITLFNQEEYSDVSVKTSETSYCYRMSYENSCGQKLAASDPICTILLKKDFTSLAWTPDLPILGGISGYTVMQTGSSGNQNEIPVQMNTGYTVQLNAQSDLEYNFQIKATLEDTDFESLSNIINFKRSAGVFVPDAFSPNGDGFNDILEAKSTQLQSFDMSIMNRWGEVIFHSSDLATGWDGTINGENAPAGSYVYKMTFVDDINQTVEKSGTFMLLR